MSLTRQQVDMLLKPINPRRVLHDNKGMAHVSQQDIRAHLTRIFGFGGWSTEVLSLDCVREAPGTKDKGFAVTYRCVLRLTIRDSHGQFVTSFDDAGTGTSPNLPTLGDAHDFAAKVAVSMALKRAATNLGDGFGLSLYNKGQTDPLVIGTLVLPDGEAPAGDIQEAVPTQVSMGHDDAGSTEPERKAERSNGPDPRDAQFEVPPPVVDVPLPEPSGEAGDPLTDWMQKVDQARSTTELLPLKAELLGALKRGDITDRDAAMGYWNARDADLRGAAA